MLKAGCDGYIEKLIKQTKQPSPMKTVKYQQQETHIFCGNTFNIYKREVFLLFPRHPLSAILLPWLE